MRQRSKYMAVVKHEDSLLGNDHNTLWSSYLYCSAAAAAKLLQSCPTLCDPIDGSPPGPAVPGILQARTLELGAISSSNAWKWKVKVKSCPTLSDPMDCSLPGSSVRGIFQARVLEWGAIAFSLTCIDLCLLLPTSYLRQVMSLAFF